MKIFHIVGLAALAMLFGCSSSPTSNEDIEKQAFDDMRTEVREVIEDAEREASVVALVDTMEAQFVVLREATVNRRKALAELNADYDATREQFAEHLDRYNADLERSQRAFLESHRALIDETTAEEWSALLKSNTKSMSKLAESLATI